MCSHLRVVAMLAQTTRLDSLQSFLAKCSWHDDIWNDPMVHVAAEIGDATCYPIANAAAVAYIVRALNEFVTQFSTSEYLIRVCGRRVHLYSLIACLKHVDWHVQRNRLLLLTKQCQR